MSKTLADFRTRLDVLLKDAAENLEQPDKDAAIVQAAVFYSDDRPLILVEDLPGTGFYDLYLPDDWEEGFSSIKQVLFPLEADERDSTELDSDDWEIYQKPEGKFLRLLKDTPAIGQTVRIKFTAQHSITEEGDNTVPDSDFDAVANLAASLAFEQLAALKVQSGDPTLGADAVDYRSKSDQYRSAGKAQRALYNQHMGRGAEVSAATGVKNLDENLSTGGDRLTHPRRTQ